MPLSILQGFFPCRVVSRVHTSNQRQTLRCKSSDTLVAALWWSSSVAWNGALPLLLERKPR
jgi:hypothetical protein